MAWWRKGRQTDTIDAPQFTTVEHVYHGRRLELVMADETSYAWYDNDWPDVPEVDFLMAHGLRTGARVFDLGAHQCVYAILLAGPVGPTGRVIAVEASAHNASASRANLSLNSIGNVDVVEAAVDQESGWVSFGRGDNGQIGDFEDSARVKAITIDELSATHGAPDVMFIDIEGFELRALRGAATTMEARPVCFIEVHVGEGLEDVGDSADALVAFFRDLGYDLYLSDEMTRQPRPCTDELYQALRTSRFFLTAVPAGN